MEKDFEKNQIQNKGTKSRYHQGIVIDKVIHKDNM